MSPAEIAGYVLSGIAVISAILVGRSGAAKDLVAAATGLVEPLKDRIDTLEQKVKCLERETTALEMWGRHLAQQVRQLGGVPIPYDEFLHAVEKGEVILETEKNGLHV